MKDKGFGERLSASRDAKKAMAAKFLQRPAPDDAAMLERQAARAAVAEAREKRNVQKEEARREAEKVKAEEAVKAAALAE
ncbi:MAG: hypothetical protein JWL93_427 [Hyphomicrobiales bacterium]|nr:hypothetical protein [Hyphomicrobiales bacterium]